MPKQFDTISKVNISMACIILCSCFSTLINILIFILSGGFQHMDPEELFRNIFGNFGGAAGGGRGNMGGFRVDDMGAYEESNFGFGSTQEVTTEDACNSPARETIC